MTSEAPPQPREHVRGRMAPPRWWQYPLPALRAGVDVLTESNLTQNHACEPVKTTSEAAPQAVLLRWFHSACFASLRGADIFNGRREQLASFVTMLAVEDV
jgi:hypothetical protein